MADRHRDYTLRRFVTYGRLIEIEEDRLVVASTSDDEEACHVMIIARPCIEDIRPLESTYTSPVPQEAHNVSSR